MSNTIHKCEPSKCILCGKDLNYGETVVGSSGREMCLVCAYLVHDIDSDVIVDHINNYLGLNCYVGKDGNSILFTLQREVMEDDCEDGEE